jgi:hypothetical protein
MAQALVQCAELAQVSENEDSLVQMQAPKRAPWQRAATIAAPRSSTACSLG